jgi:hypothetical protein
MNQVQATWPLKKPQQLVYVELGPHNGGMVLGICEQGFSFRAVAPLRADGQVNFAFSLDANRKLQGTGEIAWSEEDGKTGGLKFSNVSPQFLEALRFWLATDAEQKYVGREVTPAAALPLDTLEKPKSVARAENLEAAKPAVPSRPVEAKLSPPQPVETKPLETKPPETKPVETKPAEEAHAAVKEVVARPVETKQAEPKPVEKTSVPIVVQQTETKAAETKTAETKTAETKTAETKPIEKTSSQPRAAEPRPVEKAATDLLLPRSERKPFTQPPPDSGPALPRLRIYFPPAPPEPAAEVAPTEPVAEEDIPAEKNIPEAAPVPVDDPSEPMAPIFVPHPPEETRPLAAEVVEPAPPVFLPSRSLHPPAEIAAEETVPEEEGVAEPPRLNRAAAAGIISLALAIILGALVLSFRRETGQLLIRAGQMLAGEEKSVAENATTPVVTKPKPPAVPPEEAAYGLGAPGAANPAEKPTSGTAKQPAATAEQHTPATNVLLPPFGAAPTEGGTGQKEFEQARDILKGNRRQRDLPQAVELLWTAVRKGYVPAEVTLADLFARGDGVEKSCDQARVLLQAAIQKGSPEGRRRLELLKKQGCS